MCAAVADYLRPTKYTEKTPFEELSLKICILYRNKRDRPCKLYPLLATIVCGNFKFCIIYC